MPRKTRPIYDGAWYHIINRGAGKKTIFNNRDYFEDFLTLVKESVLLFDIEIHAYCLMENHYHILAHTPLGKINNAMQRINGIYTQRYNKKENTDGPLFRGRYHSELVETDNYLLELSRYIHNNPVKAGIIDQPELYPWSSCAAYTTAANKPSWLHCNYILNQFSQNEEKSRRAYKDFINERKTK